MSGTTRKISRFQEAILKYFQDHKRDLAFRQTTNLYEVAVSEFMLQQTQVSRVITKYEEFLDQFPTPNDLASASQAKVLSAWQGLGYNRRALWLKGLAEFLVKNPTPCYDELLTVKGVGSYTAAAILSFSQNADIAAIDVNISRIFDRYFGGVSDEFISQSLPEGRSREWHNALMDFGSDICTKRSPSCTDCPLSADCYAYQNDTFSQEKTTTQKKFVGSVRWHRGQILKALLEKPRTKEQLWYVLDQKHRDKNKFDTAIAQYLQEEFLVHRSGLFEVKQ